MLNLVKNSFIIKMSTFQVANRRTKTAEEYLDLFHQTGFQVQLGHILTRYDGAGRILGKWNGLVWFSGA